MTLVDVNPQALDVYDDPNGTVVAWCERGSAAIEQAATIADARDIRDWADTIEHASKVRDLNHETIIIASALKIRAERRIGQLLGPPTRDHDRSPGARSVTDDIGRDERYASRKLAEPDDDEFEQAIEQATEEAREKAGISRRSVLSRLDQRQQNKAETAEQREWVKSLGEDPNPELTARRQQAQMAVAGMNRGVRRLTDEFDPAELADLLGSSFPHVRDRHVSDIEHAAAALATYREALP